MNRFPASVAQSCRLPRLPRPQSTPAMARPAARSSRSLHASSRRRPFSSIPAVHRPLAVLFPGQGSQFVGMSKQLVSDFPTAARPILDQVDHILGFNLSKIMFDGPADVLTRTSHAQPAILASSAALLAVLKQETGFEVTEHADYVLGHSLGEYTALYAAGALTFEQAIELVHKRGKAMEACLPASMSTTSPTSPLRTSMVALICRPHQLDALANHIRTVVQPSLAANEVVDLSNINSSTQAVLSGTHDAIERTCKHLQHLRIAARAVELPVSAPFHCRLMQAAADAMRPHLEATKFTKPLVPVISNVTVAPVTAAEEIPGLLYRQITGTVQWQPSIQYLRERGRVRDWAVMGPNRVLGNLLRKDWPTDRVVVVEEGEEIKAVVREKVLC